MPQKKFNARRGGASAKMKKYPRIADYLQAHHPKVYALVDDLAMLGSLSPRRGGGITFLLPDSALVSKITKLMESDEPEKATDIISSLIITDYLPTVKEFAAHKDDIPTLLGKKLMVKTVGATKVDIEKGSLELDKGFTPFSRSGTAQRGNMAVWKLTGEVDYEKAPKSEGKYSGKGAARGGAKKRTHGGYSGGASDQDIDAFVQDMVNKEYRSIREQVRGTKRKSPMLRAVVNQLIQWRERDPEKYHKARAILSLHPIIAFFLIFKNRLYFPSSDLNVVSDSVSSQDVVQELKNIINDESGDACMFRDRKAVKNAVESLKDNKRMNLNAAKTIQSCYAAVDRDNAIGSCKDVYPAGAIAAFRAHPGLHLLIDEFRHFMYASIQEMNSRRSAKDQARAFNDIVIRVNDFRSLLHPAACSIMDKVDALDKAKDVQQIKEPFWNTFALFVPCTYFDEKSPYRYTGAGEDEDGNELETDVPEGDEPDSHNEEDLDRIDGSPSEGDEAELARKIQAWLDSNNGNLPLGVEGWKCEKD